MRRKLCEGYAHKWSDAASFVKSILKLPPGRFANLAYHEHLGDGFLVSTSWEEKYTALSFLRIPPVASRKPLESWSIPPFSFATMDYAAYLPEDVVAVVERNEKCVTRSLIVRSHII